MSTRKLLNGVMTLTAGERVILVEGLIRSLDEPDKAMDDIWAEDAERRLRAYRGGRLEGVPLEDLFRTTGSTPAGSTDPSLRSG